MVSNSPGVMIAKKHKKGKHFKHFSRKKRHHLQMAL